MRQSSKKPRKKAPIPASDPRILLFQKNFILRLADKHHIPRSRVLAYYTGKKRPPAAFLRLLQEELDAIQNWDGMALRARLDAQIATRIDYYRRAAAAASLAISLELARSGADQKAPAPIQQGPRPRPQPRPRPSKP
jgi:hypothetical protein